MKRKFIIMLIAFAIVLGLLLLVAYSGSVADTKQKKKATAIPSVSINPYRIPLPIMEHGITIAIRMPFRAK